MEFSVIMPSYLGKYKRAAKNRDEKIVRAVKSVQGQTFGSWEIIVIADGCEKTVEIIEGNFADLGKSKKLRLFKIPKQHSFSGTVRNVGLKMARGKFIVYLDNDDMFTENHLSFVHQGIYKNKDCDWWWFNDLSWNKNTEKFDEHICDIDIKGRCGTSNICHKSTMKARWGVIGGYSKDDFGFISRLKSESQKYKFIGTGGYGICHVPYLLDY